MSGGSHHDDLMNARRPEGVTDQEFMDNIIVLGNDSFQLQPVQGMTPQEHDIRLFDPQGALMLIVRPDGSIMTSSGYTIERALQVIARAMVGVIQG